MNIVRDNKKALGTLVMLVCTLVFLAQDAHAAGFVFSRNLKVGSIGSDVQELQKVLNTDPTTRIQESGAGSPGQETTYFGIRTRDAVIRFQEKYQQQTLAPYGLLRGTGIVGPATLSLLNILNKQSPTTTSSAPGVTPVVTPTNPNKENLDSFLAAIDSVGKKKGVSADTLETIKKQVIIDTGTSTDLRQKFIDTIERSISRAPEPAKSILAQALDGIKKFITPRPVLAQFSGGGGSFGGGGAGGSWGSSGGSAASSCVPQGGVDFGGMLLFPFFCTCSANWLLTISPLPPTFATLLTYQPGTQLCLSHNIPATTWLLGKYNPGAGNCQIYIGTGCATIPSEGMVTPFVGSSEI